MKSFSNEEWLIPLLADDVTQTRRETVIAPMPRADQPAEGQSPADRDTAPQGNGAAATSVDALIAQLEEMRFPWDRIGSVMVEFGRDGDFEADGSGAVSPQQTRTSPSYENGEYPPTGSDDGTDEADACDLDAEPEFAHPRSDFGPPPFFRDIFEGWELALEDLLGGSDDPNDDEDDGTGDGGASDEEPGDGEEPTPTEPVTELLGTDEGEVLDGGDGVDLILAGDGADTINAGGGNDIVRGDGGDDIIAGEAGDDTLWGQLGSDTFVFADGHGIDTIADFDATDALEKIDLSALTLFTSFADLEADGVMEQVGADVMIDTGDGNAIWLTDVALADLDADDFLF